MKRINPETALDIGAGSGTYARMFPDVVWSGIEIWEPYLHQYNLAALYSGGIRLADARDLGREEISGRWDVAVAGDVLEHMTVDEARALMATLRRLADYVIISIPIGYYPQDEYEGNPYEVHVKDDWSDAEVRAVFGEPLYGNVDKEIGVYVYGDKPLPESRLTIGVYAISKNEAHFVERFCRSPADADHIVIADTGSTDDTVAIGSRCGAVVYDIGISPWRFDRARNAALALMPADVDICIALDLDEVMVPGWRTEVERLWQDDTTRMHYRFDWGHGVVYHGNKIHSRHGYYWRHPVHEVLEVDRITEKSVWSDALLIKHFPDPNKSRSQYLDLLALAVKEDPTCPRNAFYHARELSYYQKWDESVDALVAYLAMPQATWQPERCYAMRILGDIHHRTGRPDEARQWYWRAIAEAGWTREPWLDLASFAYEKQDWETCHFAASNGLRIQNRTGTYLDRPQAWGPQLYDLCAIAAHRLGLHDVAVEMGKKACELEPSDERLAQNLSFYVEACEAPA